MTLSYRDVQQALTEFGRLLQEAREPTGTQGRYLNVEHY